MQHIPAPAFSCEAFLLPRASSGSSRCLWQSSPDFCRTGPIVTLFSHTSFPSLTFDPVTFIFPFQHYREASGAGSKWSQHLRTPRGICAAPSFTRCPSKALLSSGQFLVATTRNRGFDHSQTMSGFDFNWIALVKRVLNQTPQENRLVLNTSLGSLEGWTSFPELPTSLRKEKQAVNPVQLIQEKHITFFLKFSV